MKKINDWNANKYNKHANFVSTLGMPLIKILEPKAHEKILDLGCGEGSLTLEIKKFGADITAIDLSKDMVEKSRAKGLKAELMSATSLSYVNKFDAVFSNAVLHWVKESELALKNIHRSLKQNGRFIAEFGGYGNIYEIRSAIKEVFLKHKEYGVFNDLWFFPKVKEYKKMLEDNGFKVKYIELIPRPTPIDDIKNWLDVFANGIISHLTQKQQIHFKQEVTEILKSKIYNEKDGWVADYVRLRLEAYK